MVSARLCVRRHPDHGLMVVGVDANGHPVNAPLSVPDAFDLASQLENQAQRLRRFVDTREPFDDSECHREVERT